MSQKRHLDEGRVPRSEGPSSEHNRRKVPAFRRVVQEEMHSFQCSLEPLIRKVVKEQVELSLKTHLSSMKQNCVKEVCSSESKSLKLCFSCNLSLPVFTGARIEGEEFSTLQVALVDCTDGQVVKSGPESSAKVEIVVLEGDFDGDDNWTAEEFKNNIVRDRKGKKPLLTGKQDLNLKDGVGLVGDITFTDNSSWTRSRRFRLGARIVENFDGTRVKEAKTDSFIVKDRRGESYKKHHPPSLSDEVWRLEKIGKDGAFHNRLSKENISTVKDFLTLLFVDRPRLQNILGTGMSAKMWKVTVEHARTCVLDKRMFVYYPPNSQQKTGVVFNVVGQAMGLLSEREYVPIDKISDTEKVDVHNMVISAFEHWEEVECYEDEACLTGGSTRFAKALCSASSPRTVGFTGSRFQSNASPDIISSIYSIAGTSALDDNPLPSVDSIDLSRYDQAFSFLSQVTSPLICDSEPMNQAFVDEDHLQFFESDLQSQNIILESPADLQSAVDGFLFARSAMGKAAQRRWMTLFIVLKWFYLLSSVIVKRQIPRY